MELNPEFGRLPDEAMLQRTAEALTRNGIQTLIVDSGAAAKQKALEIIPQGAEVMNMTSITLQSISLITEILESGRFKPVREKLNVMDDTAQGIEKRRLGAAQEWAIGSVHAVTYAGEVLIASNTGSQLGAYAYGANHVLWIVGAQKIVKNREEGLRRIYEYSLPLEDERAHQAYGQGSNVSKILIVNKEVKPDRITLILVKEKLGF